MWHASAARGGKNDLRKICLAALAGAGSEVLGQWEEWTGRAYHVRRRLTPVEQERTGPVLDIRGTTEAKQRLEPVRLWLPAWWHE